MKSNEQIVHDLLGADADSAVEYLYDAYGSVVFGLCSKMLKTQEDAQDATQDVFIKVWKNWNRYDQDQGSVFNWLMVITRRTVYDQLRSIRSRSERRSVLQHKHKDAIEEPLAVESLDLKSHVHALKSEYAELIDLLYIAGHTQAEASKLLKIPLGTVKSRSRRALDMLREIYVGSELKSVLLALSSLILSLWLS
ncbi:MAG: sigma-70 family RNA polymerase sigma factor [Saprospiraceae bacterium]|nr:sigma-70 family RNA polymerase sigma factor [Saprospiraceae bacterium]